MNADGSRQLRPHTRTLLGVFAIVAGVRILLPAAPLLHAGVLIAGGVALAVLTFFNSLHRVR